MAEHTITTTPAESVDIRDVTDEPEAIAFTIVKRRFVDSYVRCDIPRGRRSWFLENLLIEVVDAGPEGAAGVAARRGYRFDGEPIFTPARRGLVEVSGRLVPADVVQIPEPADPVLS